MTTIFHREFGAHNGGNTFFPSRLSEAYGAVESISIRDRDGGVVEFLGARAISSSGCEPPSSSVKFEWTCSSAYCIAMDGQSKMPCTYQLSSRTS